MSDERPDDGVDRSPWWRLVEAEVERRQALEAEDELDDPWAHADPATPALTDAQRDRLAGLDDQPAVARLAGLRPDEDDDQPGVSRLGEVESSSDGDGSDEDEDQGA